jgi:hypothetical protein
MSQAVNELITTFSLAIFFSEQNNYDGKKNPLQQFEGE